MIRCGGYITSILTRQGDVYSCGHNHQGQCGLGKTISESDDLSHCIRKFTKIETFVKDMVLQNEKIDYLACGSCESIGDHQALITRHGNAYTLGYNSDGQLGMDHTATECFAQFNFTLEKIRIKKITCGYCCTYFLTQNGRVFSCGENNYGNLGLPSRHYRYRKFEKKPLQISQKYFNHQSVINFFMMCKGLHIFFQTNENFFVCGSNLFRQCGIGKMEEHINYPQKISFKDVLNIKEVSPGHGHSLLLTKDYKVYEVGRFYMGEHSYRSVYRAQSEWKIVKYLKDEKIIHVKAGYDTSFFINKKGELYVRGRNKWCQLHPQPVNAIKIPTKVQYLKGMKIKEIECGIFHHVFITEKNEVIVAGKNEYGCLGVGDSGKKKTFRIYSYSYSRDEYWAFKKLQFQYPDYDTLLDVIVKALKSERFIDVLIKTNL